MLTNNTNKTDLLKFQKSLNDQFMAIFEEKGVTTTNEGFSDTLGLTVSHNELNLFLPFNDLHTIASHVRYESSIKLKSWVLGFNHEHGNLYSVYNFEKLLEFILNNKSDFDDFTTNINSNLIYLKDEGNSFNALMVNEFKLDYTAEFTLVIDRTKQDSESNFFVPEGIDLDYFLTKNNMSELEWDIVESIKKYIKNNQFISHEMPPKIDGSINPFIYFVSKVYLDSYGQKPIFILDTKLLLKLLSNESPF